MRGFLSHVVNIVKRSMENKITLYAAQASFFIIMSAVPLIMLVISVFQAVLSITGIDWLEEAIASLPEVVGPLVSTLVNTLVTGQNTVALISVTAITIFWAASKGVYAIIIGLNNIYHIKRWRSFLHRRIIAVLYTLMFIIIFALSMVLIVFGNNLQYIIEQKIPAIAGVTRNILNIGFILTIIILVVFFTIMYTALPDGKQKLLRQLPGAVLATLGWIVYSIGMSIFVNYFSNYSSIYGNLASVILLTLWIYFCMIILMFGAELNAYLESKDLYPGRKKRQKRISAPDGNGTPQSPK